MPSQLPPILRSIPSASASAFKSERNRSTSDPDEVNTHPSELSMPQVQAQDPLSQQELAVLKQVLTEWAKTDSTKLSASRQNDIDIFDRRIEDGDVQIDGKNAISISDANPPKLPDGFAEVLAPNGTLVREARLTVYCPDLRFGQLELHGAQQPGAASSSSGGIAQVPRQSLVVTAPDGESIPLVVQPSSPKSPSPRGSASRLLKGLTKPFSPRGSRSAESAVAPNSSITALPASAAVADAEALPPWMIQQQEIEARKSETQALVNRVLGDVAPVAPRNGLPASLLGKIGAIENDINELVNTGRADYDDDKAAEHLATQIFGKLADQNLPAAVKLDCMKQLANKLKDAQPVLAHGPAIFNKMRLALSAISKDYSALDRTARDVHDALSHLSQAMTEKLRKEIANTLVDPSRFADFTGWGGYTKAEAMADRVRANTEPLVPREPLSNEQRSTINDLSASINDLMDPHRRDYADAQQIEQRVVPIFEVLSSHDLPVAVRLNNMKQLLIKLEATRPELPGQPAIYTRMHAALVNMQTDWIALGTAGMELHSYLVDLSFARQTPAAQ
jgi:hypothetical protein